MLRRLQGVVDIEEEDEDRAARRRRAAAEDDDDCEANCQLADVVDLMHDEEDELAELPHYLDGPDREMLQDLTSEP